MNEIKGDLIALAHDGVFDAMVHGANCMNVMGAGIAKQVKSEFPQAFEADARTQVGDPFKLGTYSKARAMTTTGYPFYVLNGYSQYHLGANADLNAIISVIGLINIHFKGKTIGMPHIGCGIGGLDWEEVRSRINEIPLQLNLIAVEYAPSPPKDDGGLLFSEPVQKRGFFDGVLYNFNNDFHIDGPGDDA